MHTRILQLKQEWMSRSLRVVPPVKSLNSIPSCFGTGAGIQSWNPQLEIWLGLQKGEYCTITAGSHYTDLPSPSKGPPHSHTHRRGHEVQRPLYHTVMLSLKEPPWDSHIDKVDKMIRTLDVGKLLLVATPVQVGWAHKEALVAETEDEHGSNTINSLLPGPIQLLPPPDVQPPSPSEKCWVPSCTAP